MSKKKHKPTKPAPAVDEGFSEVTGDGLDPHFRLKLVQKSTKQGPNFIGYEEKRRIIILHMQGRFWRNFRLSGNPKELASYIRFGGDIDDQDTRNIVADFLANAEYKKGGGIPADHLDFYHEVNDLVKHGPDAAYEDFPWNAEDQETYDLEVGEWKSKYEPMKKGEAINYLIEKWRLPIGPSGGRSRYKKGQELAEKMNSAEPER